jgi:hypothetical protein
MLKTVYGHLLCEIRPEKKEKKKKRTGETWKLLLPLGLYKLESPLQNIIIALLC